MKQGDKTIGKLFGELGITKRKNYDRFWNELFREHPDEAKSFNDALEARSSGSDIDIHSIKNQSIGFANRIFSQFDSDRVRAFLNWLIKENLLSESQTALEIGCDHGVFLCACAKLYPDVQFIGIDRCMQAISIAKKRAEIHQLDNVQFLCSQECEWKDIGLEPCDFVFTLTTMHEVLGDSSISSDLGLGNCQTSPFSFAPEHTQLDLSVDQKTALSSIRNLLNQDGLYISLERISNAHDFHLWTHALSQSGLGVDFDRSYKITFTNHQADSESMPITVAHHARQTEPPTWHDNMSFWIYEEFMKRKDLHTIEEPDLAEVIYESLQRSPVVSFTIDWANGSGTMLKTLGTAGSLFYIYTSTSVNYRHLLLVPRICIRELLPAITQELSSYQGHVQMSANIHDEIAVEQYGLSPLTALSPSRPQDLGNLLSSLGNL